MTDTQRIGGVLSPDPDRFLRQCRWLLSQNVGLAVFGTNSEANSLAVEEKTDRLLRVTGLRAAHGAIAHYAADAEWATVRPPLVALSSEQSKGLVAELDQKQFAMPGLGAP